MLNGESPDRQEALMAEIGQTVLVHYTGRFDDGTIFDSSIRRGEPLRMVVGKKEMLSAFEEAVCKLGLHEEIDIDVPACEAYGAYDETRIETIPIESFPHAEQLPVGKHIVMPTPDGDIRVKVLKMENGLIFFDHNHELAGKNLHFNIRLVGIEHESAIEHEKHADGCACGCHILKKSLRGEGSEN